MLRRAYRHHLTGDGSIRTGADELMAAFLDREGHLGIGVNTIEELDRAVKDCSPRLTPSMQEGSLAHGASSVLKRLGKRELSRVIRTLLEP